LLASRYVQEFDEKWVQGGASSNEELMGSGDIQSLAAVTLAPLLPLTLTIFSLEDVLLKVIQILL